jgi:hypothetical protein
VAGDVVDEADGGTAERITTRLIAQFDQAPGQPSKQRRLESHPQSGMTQ